VCGRILISARSVVHRGLVRFATVERSVEDLRAQVAGRDWYHTLELAPGVLTPGWFDTRRVLGEIPLPASLAGKRCLDVGTFDGFWAFEMERRGAAEVVAIDLLDHSRADWPPNSRPETVAAISRHKGQGGGFEIAKEWLGSSVTRQELSVYDVDPEALGKFDFVYLGSLLLHLRDPVRALDRLRRVCTGELLIVDTIDPLLTLLFPRRPVASLDMLGRPWWWTCNAAGIARMSEAAGFRVLGRPKRLFMPPGAGQALPRLRPKLLFSRAGRQAALMRLRGDPHVAVRAVPVDEPVAQPPATAGRMVTSSPSETGVSRPSRNRMSSPPTYTLTNRLSPPSSAIRERSSS
jgi:tRNA (mo5U34)-methyltransferase